MNSLKRIFQPAPLTTQGIHPLEQTSLRAQITGTQALLLGAIMAAGWLILLLGRGVIPDAVNSYFFELPENPYFVPQNAVLLYVLCPLVVLASLIVWLYPGLLLMLVVGREQRWTSLTPKAFLLSLGFYFLVITLVKLILPATPSPTAFLSAVAVGEAVLWGYLTLKIIRGGRIYWPRSTKSDLRRLVWGFALIVLLFIVMLPVFLWQDMHDDGFEALEIGRSLSNYLLVRFPNPTGFLGLGVGMIPMAFPIHWMLILFGPIEASARLPLLLYLPIVFCLLVELIEWRSTRKLGILEEFFLLVGLGIYALAMSYNATYDVYIADIAAPTALETMTILTILGTIYFLWAGQTAWFLAFAVLSYLCRPTGLMLLGLVGIASFAIFPDQRKSWLAKIGIAILLCLGVSFFYDRVYLPLVAGMDGVGYQSTSALSRMRYIRLNEFSRINFGLFPSGILPFLSLIFVWKQDRYARMISVVVLLYFLFFFFQGFASMHHFVPAMILPLIVFWRIYLTQDLKYPGLVLGTVALGAVISIWLSLPNSYEINRTVRNIGQKIAIEVGDYDQDYRAQVIHGDLLFNLFPPDWDVTDETKELVTGYASLIYYATRPKAEDTEINYIVRSLNIPAPMGSTQVAMDDTAAIYVKDLEAWRRDRYQPMRTDAQSRIYDLPRSSMFFYFFWRKMPDDQIVFDIKQLVDWGISLVK